MHGRTGHIWQNRFYSCPLDANHYFTALSYIEQNPVRAKMVRSPWTYRWSSAGFHVGMEAEFGLIDKNRWHAQSSGIDWKKILQSKPDRIDLDRLRIHCRTGRPLGTDKFISKLETAIGRRLRALPVGRPKKSKIKQRKNK